MLLSTTGSLEKLLFSDRSVKSWPQKDLTQKNLRFSYLNSNAPNLHFVLVTKTCLTICSGELSEIFFSVKKSKLTSGSDKSAVCHNAFDLHEGARASSSSSLCLFPTKAASRPELMHWLLWNKISSRAGINHNSPVGRVEMMRYVIRRLSNLRSPVTH